MAGNHVQWGSESRPFVNRKHLKSSLFEGQTSNGRDLAIASYSSPKYLKTGIFEICTFLSRFQKVFFTKWSGFQKTGLPDFRSHLKFRPFATQPPFLNHSKSRLVQISDPYCTIRVGIQIPDYLVFKWLKVSNC